jgi:truncated hemoglobin YjbI
MPPSLFLLAAASSGISRARAEKATTISPTLHSRLGDTFFAALAAAFYSRVYSDPSFRLLFANTTRDEAERNQREYLAQTFGGPRAYAARKGVTAIIGRHAPYPVDAAGAGTWLRYMEEALDEGLERGTCDEECREMLADYFQFNAYFIVHGRALCNPGRTVGYYGKHREGEV